MVARTGSRALEKKLRGYDDDDFSTKGFISDQEKVDGVIVAWEIKFVSIFFTLPWHLPFILGITSNTVDTPYPALGLSCMLTL